jgi:hypothetical protein
LLITPDAFYSKQNIPVGQTEWFRYISSTIHIFLTSM